MSRRRRVIANLVRGLGLIGILGVGAVQVWLVGMPTEVERRIVDGLVAEKHRDSSDDGFVHVIDVVGYGRLSVSAGDYVQLAVGRRYGLELRQEEIRLASHRQWSLVRVIDQRSAQPGDEDAVRAQAAGTGWRTTWFYVFWIGTGVIALAAMAAVFLLACRWARRIHPA